MASGRSARFRKLQGSARDLYIVKSTHIPLHFFKTTSMRSLPVELPSRPVPVAARVPNALKITSSADNIDGSDVRMEHFKKKRAHMELLAPQFVTQRKVKARPSGREFLCPIEQLEPVPKVEVEAVLPVESSSASGATSSRCDAAPLQMQCVNPRTLLPVSLVDAIDADGRISFCTAPLGSDLIPTMQDSLVHARSVIDCLIASGCIVAVYIGVTANILNRLDRHVSNGYQHMRILHIGCESETGQMEVDLIHQYRSFAKVQNVRRGNDTIVASDRHILYVATQSISQVWRHSAPSRGGRGHGRYRGGELAAHLAM